MFAGLPILIFGKEILFRIKCLIPGDLLTGIAGDAAHDAHHGGIAHAGAIVDGVAIADAGVHLVMLYLIHVWLRAFIAPDAVLVLDDALAAGDRGAALGAVDIIVVLAMAAGNLALTEEASGAVFEEVVDLDMIPDVAGIIRALATANGYGATRRFVAKEPRDFVDAVHGLFHQTIAPAPSEVVPVAHLPLDKITLYIAHQTQGKLSRENTRILCLVFLENIGLNRAANSIQRSGLDLSIGFGVKNLITGNS